MDLQHLLLLIALFTGALTLAFAHVPTWNAIVFHVRNLLTRTPRAQQGRGLFLETTEPELPECRHSWMGAVTAGVEGIRLHRTPCTDPVLLTRPGLVVDMFAVRAGLRTDEVRGSALEQGMCQHCVDQLLPAGCYVFDKDEMLRRCTDVMRPAYRKGAAA